MLPVRHPGQKTGYIIKLVYYKNSGNKTTLPLTLTHVYLNKFKNSNNFRLASEASNNLLLRDNEKTISLVSE